MVANVKCKGYEVMDPSKEGNAGRSAGTLTSTDNERPPNTHGSLDPSSECEIKSKFYKFIPFPNTVNLYFY